MHQIVRVIHVVTVFWRPLTDLGLQVFVILEVIVECFDQFGKEKFPRSKTLNLIDVSASAIVPSPTPWMYAVSYRAPPAL